MPDTTTVVTESAETAPTKSTVEELKEAAAAVVAAAPEAAKAENGNGEAAAENGNGTTETNGNGAATEEEAAKEEEKKEDPPKEMRSIVLSGFGGYKGVKILKKPEPTAQAGEVLIRVRACGLNFQDLMARLGAIDSPPKTPTILGFECAGEVEAVGEGVEDFQVGDRVVALPEFRAWAELCAVPTKFVYKIPDELSFQDAAAMAMNYLAAYIIVYDLLSLRPGKSVVLHSAGGGVGQAIAQLIRSFDDITVFGVCSKGKHEELEKAGLFTHLIDRTDYVNEIRKISPEGVDIVLDCLCGEDCNRGYGLLKPMGKYVLFGSSNVVTGETKSFFSVARSWWQVDKVSPIKLFDENKTFAGFNLRHLLYQQGGVDYCRSVMDKIFQLNKEGKAKPLIDSVWALEDVTEAMQKMHDRKNIGKIVLDPAAEPKPKPATPAKTKAKKEKKEKVQSPTTEEKKEEGAAAAEDTNGEASAEKPAENGEGDSKPKENGESAEKTTENGEQAAAAEGEEGKKKTSTLTRLTKMLSK